MSVYPAESGASEAIEEGAPFRLLDLPRELRDRVYHYAYVPSSSDLIITEKNRRKTLCVAKPSILLGPLHVVSHQIHDELEEYLARLPNETVTTNWVMTCGFFAVQHDATRLARCPKMTSVIFEVACTWHGWPSWFTYDAIVCYELLALVYLFRTRGTKVQTVTFDHSAEALSHGPSCVWSDRVEMRNHGVVPQKGDLKITVNVRTLEISELSGSLAPVLKMELIEALEDFQGLLLVDEPRNASLWLSETELVQHEDEKSQRYLSYLEWLCNEEWKNTGSWKAEQKHKWPPYEHERYWILERGELQESPPEHEWEPMEPEESTSEVPDPEVPDDWNSERSESQELPTDAPE